MPLTSGIKVVFNLFGRFNDDPSTRDDEIYLSVKVVTGLFQDSVRQA